MKGNTIGFVGLGNMGSALLTSLLKSEKPIFNEFNIYDIDENKIQNYSNLPVTICSSLEQLVLKSEFILLAVKPQVMQKVLEQIAKLEIDDKKVITIAAGLQISFYREILGENCLISRVMPNTPYLVGEGAAGITLDDRLTSENKTLVISIFEQSGSVVVCEEKYLDVVTGLSGSGPAYIFIIIEALADGAVKMGLNREQAYSLAAQTVYGAAKMVLDMKKHPGILKDMVTSPGGTTIEAIGILERGRLRATLMDAVEAATKKSQSFHS